MAVTRDENGHLQPDYNYRRPSDNPDARELEKYRWGRRPSKEEYPDQSSYAAPSRAGFSRSRAYEQAMQEQPPVDYARYAAYGNGNPELDGVAPIDYRLPQAIPDDPNYRMWTSLGEKYRPVAASYTIPSVGKTVSFVPIGDVSRDQDGMVVENRTLGTGGYYPHSYDFYKGGNIKNNPSPEVNLGYDRGENQFIGSYSVPPNRVIDSDGWREEQQRRKDLYEMYRARMEQPD